MSLRVTFMFPVGAVSILPGHALRSESNGVVQLSEKEHPLKRPGYGKIHTLFFIICIKTTTVTEEF